MKAENGTTLRTIGQYFHSRVKRDGNMASARHACAAACSVRSPRSHASAGASSRLTLR